MSDDAEKLPLLCTWIVRNGQLIGNIKRDILAHVSAGDNKYSTLTYERCRLRKKYWKSISKVYTDDNKIGDDVQLTSTSDVSSNGYFSANGWFFNKC